MINNKIEENNEHDDLIKLKENTMNVVNNNKQESVFSPSLLMIYYGRLFPYQEMFRWLSYGNDPSLGNQRFNKADYFNHREWSFTIADDIYIRYQCFSNLDEFTKAIQSRQPHKIDIGAIYTHPPKEHHTIKSSQFKPVERELVFDIDLTDYDDIRTCCQGASVCNKCWFWMSAAVKVVHRALIDDFGFEHILWVFSGRRGVHCWVCDESARELNDAARTAIINYLSLLEGNENTNEKIGNITYPPHPSLARAYQVLEPRFISKILESSENGGQGYLSSPALRAKLLKNLPNEKIKQEVLKIWNENTTLSPEELWEIPLTKIKEYTDKHQAKKQKVTQMSRDEKKLLNLWKFKVVFEYTYPRLDVNVSQHRNHLLKSPFVIHPKTGKVCIPFNPDLADDFTPDTVPTLVTLIDELNEAGKVENVENNENNENENDMNIVKNDDNNNENGDNKNDDNNNIKKDKKKRYEDTSLKYSIEYFEKSFLKPLYASIRQKRREESEKSAALFGDF